MNWFHDVIRWSHISTVPIFSTPFTGFLFATSAGLAPLRRSGNAHLKVAPAQCVYGFYFLSDFRPCPTTVDPTSVPVMGRSSSTPSTEGCGVFYRL